MMSCTNEVPVESVSLNSTQVEMLEGESYLLKAVVSPFNATNQHLIWISSNANVVEVEDGVVTALMKGDAEVTVQTDDGGKTATCKVVVKASDDNQNDDSDQGDGDDYDENLNPKGKVPDADDPGVYLGLSVNWAEHNLGAEDKEDVGGYYGWGDVTGSYYSSDLAYYPSVIPPENISGTKYDIVTQKWGNGWRMPTKEEWEELVETLSMKDEGNGWLVYDEWNSSKRIFIPKAQIRVNRNFTDMTAYWTSDLGQENSDMAYSFIPGKAADNCVSPMLRSYGMPIRPVKDINYKYDPKDLTYILDGIEFKMVFVEGNDEVESFYIMQTELSPSSYLQIGDDLIGVLDADHNSIITRNELSYIIETLEAKTQIGFRLPTPEEWLYAAKGGNKSHNYKYSGSDSIDKVAWYNDNSLCANKVAQKDPNELGIYDMTGNYEEVCSELRLFSYIDGDTYGGSWRDDASRCTVTSWKEGNSSGAKADRIHGSDGNYYSNKNAADGRYITVRLVYSLK